VDAGGLALFALLFAWQLPHFLAISIYLKEDYARGGHRVFALVHGERLARAGIAASSLALLPIALLPSWLGLAGWGYGLTAGVATAALAGAALAGLGRRGEGTRWARGFFLGTLAWLTVVMAALFAGAGA
jgi:protoheme IX farnesyltransferase